MITSLALGPTGCGDKTTAPVTTIAVASAVTAGAAIPASIAGASLALQVLTNSCIVSQARHTNTGGTPVNLSDISIKYWLDDTSGQAVAANLEGTK